MLCNDLIAAQDYNERVTNFMLDLYRAALRYFFLAMLFIMILGIGKIISLDSNWMSNIHKINELFKQEVYKTYKSLNENKINVEPNLKASLIPYNASSKIVNIAPSSAPQF